MSRERDRDAAAMMPVVNARAEVTERPRATALEHAQNMRIKGMGKGSRSPARPLVCSGRTREMERLEKNQVKQNIRPTEQGIERGSNNQNQTSVGFSRP